MYVVVALEIVWEVIIDFVVYVIIDYVIVILFSKEFLIPQRS